MSARYDQLPDEAPDGGSPMDERRGMEPDASSSRHAVRRNSALAHGTMPRQQQESPPRALSPQRSAHARVTGDGEEGDAAHGVQRASSLHLSPRTAEPPAADAPTKKKRRDHSGVPTDRELGVPTPASVRGYEDRAADATWRNRPSFDFMMRKREEEARREGLRAAQKTEKKVNKTVGPFAETLGVKDAGKKTVKYGRIRFEENGRVVPYLIVPERMRDSAELREIIVKHMKHVTPSTGPEGRPLSKPSTIFDISAGGASYLEVSKQPVSCFRVDELRAAAARSGRKKFTRTRRSARCGVGVKKSCLRRMPRGSLRST